MEIEIGAITLDVANFRHAQVTHERDAIRLLLADDKTHKVTDLANDIVEEASLDPSSRLIVTEDEAAAGKYICLEGNRRITALKTMITPQLAEGLPVHSVFRHLSPLFLSLNLKTVDCVVLDRPTAAKWIKRKHYKGMGGEAVQQWNAVATARSDASEGVYSRWMTSLAFLEENGIDAEEIRDRIARKTTTVERVLISANVPAMLGLQYDRSGTVKPENGDNQAALTLIQALLEAMAEPSFKETLVSTKGQQQAWLEKFRHLNVKQNDEDDDSSGDRDETDDDPQGSGDDAGSTKEGGAKGTNSGDNAESGSQTAGPTKRSRSAKSRAVLADKGLRISNANLNKFYGELRRLKVDRNPFISAAIIRVFLEKATTDFLETTGVPTLDQRDGATWHDFGVKLRSKVDAALQQLDPSGRNPKFAAARDVANGNQDRLHSLDELNRAIHDHTALPAPSEIITIWNRFHPYFDVLFEGIENNEN